MFPLLSPQQFGIWLDSSSPEQTVPYLWSEETPSSESPSGLPAVSVLGFAAGERDAAKQSLSPRGAVHAEASGAGLKVGEQTLANSSSDLGLKTETIGRPSLHIRGHVGYCGVCDLRPQASQVRGGAALHPATGHRGAGDNCCPLQTFLRTWVLCVQ